MEFLIADTFTDSLAKLTGDEQKAAKTTAFDLQLNPSSPGLQFHRLDKPKDPNFWSVRVNRDVRLIVHRTGTSLMLCYVSHHDEAYKWAERRRLETHPKTGAAQLVEVRERIEEITIPRYVEAGAPPKPQLFAGLPDDQLLQFGVPQEWLPDVKAANEDTLLTISDHLPKEAAEALLELATGAPPQVLALPDMRARASAALGQVGVAAFPSRVFSPVHSVGARLRAAGRLVSPRSAEPSALLHPDAQRRFRAINSPEELQQALEYPWEKWIVFLHPAQKQIVERTYNGPARVAGSAGTGKTIVALHRTVHLARSNPDSRLLLTTFSEPLANALRSKLRQLISNEPKLGERIEVHAMNSIGQRLYELNISKLKLAPSNVVRDLLVEAAKGVPESKFSTRFLLTEWEQVVDAWQLDTWEAYRDVARLGRKTRLKEPQRALLWKIFESAKAGLKQRGLISYAAMFNQLASFFAKGVSKPFDFIVVDESQDIGIAQLRFLASVSDSRPNALFFAGDLGQRIFQQPFSWKALGVDIRGRSSTLRVNYRTSHQIRSHADRLLGPDVADVDGNVEERKGTVSMFNGPEPQIKIFDSNEEEETGVAGWAHSRLKEGLVLHEIAVFVRSSAQVDRAKAALDRSGIPYQVLDREVQVRSGKASIATMHLAKGLEFRAVVVMACDDEVIPLQSRIETVTDDSDLEDVYNTERQLLYVACTRARDYLLVTGVEPGSEFLEDMYSD